MSSNAGRPGTATRCRTRSSSARAIRSDSPRTARQAACGYRPNPFRLLHSECHQMPAAREPRPDAGRDRAVRGLSDLIALALLDKLLAGIGLTRSDCYIANVIKCRPPGNRDPMPDEIEQCEGYQI